ncbi:MULTISPECIES: RNA polymerase sigma factor [Paenibacillus]|uniref:RNA polymerase sigma factor n=1 Tax=Paenibacillus TaxID=44249 RepID=UPI00036D3735|nr:MULTISPECIES: sigma-70 family RNA polymerase sigma factor [Paenibacillus]
MKYTRKEDILAARAGEKDAFIQLMRDMERPLYRMARSMLRSDDECDDAVQETMLKAFRNIHTLREVDYFQTWIFRILINECHNIARKGARVVVTDEWSSLPARTDEYERIDMQQAVHQLPEPQRLVIAMHYFQDMPIQQIADVLDLSAEAVKTRLHRARKTLMDWLSDEPGRGHQYETR